jgi:ribonucleoside-diphosphate reductase alpha chain
MRQTLPSRRAHEVFSFRHWNAKYHVGIGRAHPSSPIQEIWLNTNKTGTQSETLARDSAVVLSIALQCGATIEMLRHAITRDLDGRASGPIGALLDRLAGDEGAALLPDPPGPKPAPVPEYSDQ